MALIRNILTFILILLPNLAQACPSCAASNNGRLIEQRMLLVAVMWLMPTCVAAGLGVVIFRICRKSAGLTAAGSK